MYLLLLLVLQLLLWLLLQLPFQLLPHAVLLLLMVRLRQWRVAVAAAVKAAGGLPSGLVAVAPDASTSTLNEDCVDGFACDSYGESAEGLSTLCLSLVLADCSAESKVRLRNQSKHLLAGLNALRGSSQSAMN